ncbi:PaaI family thioesterase [Rhodococcus opacus]|uniref:PaaI family thioesterase n=1 Tax=Rhodococcus opacus TaxID=37919 RepID=UPI0006BB4BB4|nr:PaaI family thioesterase [Rhodococcus opacus]MDJ0420254.1 PaaI family thioesterase [Rhodococcus opacus]MDV7090084.1 PaaI family thioesterase [Rhodococcus opacus]UNN04562.1 PaaI family thioesterase [Rhodococcus opacus]WKN52627.1 PaaI family thioesterase [Rhodococcus opacus]
MTHAAAPFDADSGWSAIADDGFLGLVGPMWIREGSDGHPQFALECQAKHRNLGGVVQGGVLMTLADRALGSAALGLADTTNMATVQLDVHFVAPARIGDLVTVTPQLIRRTRDLMFMRADLVAADHVVATATGVFKPLHERTAADARRRADLAG